MLVLAVDTATAATATDVVALPPMVAHGSVGHTGNRGLDQDVGLRLLARDRYVDPRRHGERLAPQIDAVMDAAGVRPADLTAIVAGIGPGPFTGLRVGLATAAAMGQALGIPTYGVCSLDGIGVAAHGRALVATDARRREIYWAIYRDGARITDPAVSAPWQLAPALAHHAVARAYGEGALRHRAVLGLPVADAPLYPDPSRLVIIAHDRIAAVGPGERGEPGEGGEPSGPGERLTPLYLRRPDAAQPRPPKPVSPR